MGKVVHLGNRFFGEASLEACQELTSVTPEGLDKVVLCSTGTEANELAIRIARAATGHHELVGVQQGYYGCSHETMSLSDYVGFIQGIGTRSAGVHRLASPNCQRCPMGQWYPDCNLRCLEYSASVLEAESTGKIAAFLVEPILGSGGIIVPPDEWFTGVKKLAERFGALLIADEAQTGMGRTGRWMGMDHTDVTPDILVLSKGVGAGFPVAAVITTGAIEDRCIEAPLANMSSHSFDPFAGAIAAETVRILSDEGLVEQAEERGRYLRDALSKVADKYDFLGNPRGRGLMVGMDVTSLEGGDKLQPMLSLALEAECMIRGLVLGYSSLSGVVRLLPPLVITEEEIDRAATLLDGACAHVEQNGVEVFRYMPKHLGSARLAMAFLGKLED